MKGNNMNFAYEQGYSNALTKLGLDQTKLARVGLLQRAKGLFRRTPKATLPTASQAQQAASQLGKVPSAQQLKIQGPHGGVLPTVGQPAGGLPVP